MKTIGEIIFMSIMIIINIAILPFSLGMGFLGKAIGDSILNFLMGFAAIQFIPLGLLVVSIVLYQKKIEIINDKENEVSE